MFATIIALIIAILIHFSRIGQEAIPNIPTMGIILITVATLFLFIPSIVMAMAWGPLQRAEEHLTPRIFELFRKDSVTRAARLWLLIFPLITYVIAIDILFLNLLNRDILLPVWLVLLGITIDALYQLIKRIGGYLDPYYVANLFAKQAQKSVQNEEEAELCHWIDALSEIAIKAVKRNSVSLTNHVCNSMQHVGSLFLQSYKSISHRLPDPDSQKIGITDTVSYTLIFLLQRLEMINDKAVEQKLEPVCSNLVSVFGKITISAAKFDLSLPSYPLQFLGRAAVNAEHQGLTEVGPKASIMLVQVAKSILTETDIKYAELQDPFFTLTSQLSEISREMFRQNKHINIKLLTQPFEDLKALFAEENVATHQDTPVIVQNINSAIAEFDALQTVLRTIPPIPKDLVQEDLTS